MTDKSDYTIDQMMQQLDVRLSFDKANESLAKTLEISPLLTTSVTSLCIGLFMSDHMSQENSSELIETAISGIELALKYETNPKATGICQRIPFTGSIGDEDYNNIAMADFIQMKKALLSPEQKTKLFTALKITL